MAQVPLAQVPLVQQQLAQVPLVQQQPAQVPLVKLQLVQLPLEVYAQRVPAASPFLAAPPLSRASTRPMLRQNLSPAWPGLLQRFPGGYGRPLLGFAGEVLRVR